MKEYEYPTTCNEKVLDWYCNHHNDTPDIDPDMSFIDLYIGLDEGDMDAFIACGEDCDVLSDILYELAERMDDDFDRLHSLAVGETLY